MKLVDIDDLKLRIEINVLKETEKRRYGSLYIGLIDKFKKVLSEAPEIMPEKRGCWDIYVISQFDGEGCRCSLCGNEGTPNDNFCSNCGAGMRMEGNGHGN